MAKLDRRRLFNGTTASRGVVDIRRSSFRELLHYIEVSSGDVEEAVSQALQDVPVIRNVAGANVVLRDVSGRMTSCDTAIVTARYGANVFNTNPGFDSIEMELGYEQVQWIQTSAKKIDESKLTGKIDIDDYYFMVQNILNADVGRGQFDPVTFVPNGAANSDAAGKPIPYSLKVPVWNIRVRTVLEFHPGPQIGIYAAKPVNDSAVTWSGFLFPDSTLRFNGARVRQQGDNYYVTYSFTHRWGKWVEQRLIGNDKPLVDLSGAPQRDAEGNVKRIRSAGWGTFPMYAATSYSQPGFPAGS